MRAAQARGWGWAARKVRAAAPAAAGLALALSACGVSALGFGTSDHASLLGQPLSFSVPLRIDADEFVSVECVFATVTAGDNRIAPAQVRVNLLESREPGGVRSLRVTTTATIDEPVVTVEIGVGCPVRLSRQFVAFVDPPTVGLAQAAPVEAPRAEAPQAPSAEATGTTTPLPPSRPSAEVRSAETPPAPRKVARRAARPVARPSVIPVAPGSVPEPRAPAERVAKLAPPATAERGGPRLKLETAEAPRKTLTALPAASAPAPAEAALALGAAEAAAALAATLPAAESEAQQREAEQRERARQLEESLAKLKAETEATRASIASLQSRLREAESREPQSPIVYGLAALSIVLGFAVIAMLLLLRSRERQHAEWWAAGAQDAPPRPRGARQTVKPVQVPVSPESELPAVSVLPLGGDTQPATPTTRPLATWKQTHVIPELDQGDARKRAVSAEELIDLEQQAEFFITLGQDESAIDLLVAHIGSAGGASPLPYLKLLEIHRRRHDRPAYDGVREHFNKHFNAHAPAYGAASAASRPLEEHAAVIEQLEAVWNTPPRAMGLLESLLFRQDAGDAGFDLGAYREVLFLHEIARDRYEHETSGTTVDVLLPLDDGDAEPLTNPLLATMPVPPHPEVERPIVVDVDLTKPRDVEAEAAAARSDRRRERYGDSDFAGIGDDYGAPRGGRNSR